MNMIPYCNERASNIYFEHKDTLASLPTYRIILFPFFLAANLITNFGVAVTFESFITMSLILSVPVCAGKYDILNFNIHIL